MLVRLKMLDKGTVGGLRTKLVTGVAVALPVIGDEFEMFADPLDATEGQRFIETTPVRTIKKLSETNWVFKTRNTTYGLELLEEEDA